MVQSGAGTRIEVLGKAVGRSMSNKQGPADFRGPMTGQRSRTNGSTAFSRTPRNAFVDAGLAPWAGVDAPLPLVRAKRSASLSWWH